MMDRSLEMEKIPYQLEEVEGPVYDVVKVSNKVTYQESTTNPCYNIFKSQQHDNLNNEILADVKKKPTTKICFFVVVSLVLVCVCISLSVSVWSVVEVRRLSNSFAGPKPENEAADSGICSDSITRQVKELQENVSLLSFELNEYTVAQEIANQTFSEAFEFQLHKLITFQNTVNQSLTEATGILHDQLATIQPFLTQFPASSCLQVSLVNSSSSSGYYWVRASNGSAVRVYCDMTRSCGGVTGGWTRVAYLQFENGSDPCPDGFRERRDSGIRTCGISSQTAACPSIFFDPYGIPYSRVCGKVQAYQYASTDGFGRGGSSLTIDSNYVDGVSLTHGKNPRHHIWTFTAALDEDACSCSNPEINGVALSPAFVGQDYFCESGVRGAFSTSANYIFHSTNPLWDGEGCGAESSCCEFNNPPWFHKQLPQPTIDDIEMRVCSNEIRSNEDIPIASIDIYVL